MDTYTISFNNGIVKNYPKGTTFYEVCKDCNLENIVAYRKNNEVFSLDNLVDASETIEFINTDDIIGNKIYKAGLKFLFEVALKEIYPDLEVSYEHSVPRGMLARIIGDKKITLEDIALIKGQMCKIIDANDRFIKLNISAKDTIKYYLQKKEYEKANNIQNISDKVAILYKLRGKFNYFYSLMPYSTGVINKFELVYLEDNKIVIMFPTVKSKGSVPEYVHYEKIIDSFLSGKKWLSNLNVSYITDLNKIVSDGGIKRFIKACELKFNLDLSNVVNDLKKKKSVKFILIAGPSSSGKTTTTNVLATHLDTMGYDPIKISLDNYFVDRENNPKDENGEYDFECLESIDVDLFNKQLNALLNNEEVILPQYNFLTGKREEGKEKIKIKSNSIFLIEGLHALNDELTKEIEDKYKYKIYLSPFIPLSIDIHNYISTLDLRLLRRIVRDNRTRGYNVIDTIDKWQNVRNGEEKYIFPYIHQADVIINTALAYEIGVLKIYVEPLLLSVSVSSIYFEEARRLIDFLKQFFPIPGEYVSDESILREFIGGNND